MRGDGLALDLAAAPALMMREDFVLAAAPALMMLEAFGPAIFAPRVVVTVADDIARAGFGRGFGTAALPALERAIGVFVDVSESRYF